MKIKAYLIKETDAAMLFGNSRLEHRSTVWIPRSIINHVTKLGNRTGEEHLERQCFVTIPDWFVAKTPALDEFKEV